jgi:hypothetical protein
MSIMQRRQVLRLIGGGVVAAAVAPLSGCSSDLPASAIAAWNGPSNESDLRRWVLSHAILAPHSHNLQSWLVDLREPDTMTLHMDISRILPHTDPYSRQMVMSQGTFLEIVDLAARQRGYRADIEFFPDGEYPATGPDERATARIRLVQDARIATDPLFAQIFRRHTNRLAYAMRVPDSTAVAAIDASVAGYSTATGYIGIRPGDDVQAHREIAMQAWKTEITTPRTMMESLRLVRIGPDEIDASRDGISINKPMVRFLSAVGLFDRDKAPPSNSTLTQHQIDDFNDVIASTPAFFWMTTDGNDRKTQLLAGRAYVRAQLAATAHGLSMQPLQQALQEYPEQSNAYAAIHALVGAQRPKRTVQMWARLGYGPQIGPSPRRGLEAHLIRS